MHVRVFWIDSPTPGRLGVMPRPRGGDWLPDEISSLQQQGVGRLVSLLTQAEADELGLTEQAQCCEACGILFCNLPIIDRGIPSDKDSVARLAEELSRALSAGEDVVIHCRQGIGRATLAAAATLICAGLAPENALDRIETGRGCPVPDTSEQRAWILSFEL